MLERIKPSINIVRIEIEGDCEIMAIRSSSTREELKRMKELGYDILAVDGGYLSLKCKVI